MRKDKMREAKIRAGHYCAYQERTQQEVRDKLYNLGLYSEEVEEVLTELIVENYVNEERYAKSFAGGKFRVKQWGKGKIKFELKKRKISSYCIDLALAEIADEEYEEAIKQLIQKKAASLVGDEFIIKNKTARYVIGKGYEPEIVWSTINQML